MTLKTFLLICVSAFALCGFSQTKKDSTAKQELPVIKQDSVVDGRSFNSTKVIAPVADSLDFKALKDLPEAAELDKKWLEEL